MLLDYKLHGMRLDRRLRRRTEGNKRGKEGNAEVYANFTHSKKKTVQFVPEKTITNMGN